MKKGLVQSDGYLGILQLKRRQYGGKVWENVPDSQEAWSWTYIVLNKLKQFYTEKPLDFREDI